MTFSELKKGEYFTMKKGLIWVKIDENHARDVWGGRVFLITQNVEVTKQFDIYRMEYKEKLI